MLFHKYFLSLSIAIFLIVPLSSILAAQSDNHIPKIMIPTESPMNIQLNLLNEIITDYNPSMSQVQKKLVSTIIWDEANSANFDPLLISSIIAAESSFFPEAVSPCEALGLMQITSAVIELTGIMNPFDVQENIYAGTKYLTYLKKQFNDSHLLLAAYNAGPTRVARLKRIPNIKETINYVNKVTQLYKNLKNKLIATIQEILITPTLCSAIPFEQNQKNINLLYSNVKKQPFQKSFIDLCEVYFSDRFFSIFKKYASKVLSSSLRTSFTASTFFNVSFH